MTWISNSRKLWKKDVLGVVGALAVEGEAKGRVWECEATTGQLAFPELGEERERMLRLQEWVENPIVLEEWSICRGQGKSRVERGKGELPEQEVRTNWVAWDRPEQKGDVGIRTRSWEGSRGRSPSGYFYLSRWSRSS